MAEKQHDEDRKVNQQISVDEVGGGTKIGEPDISIPPRKSGLGLSGPDVDVTGLEEKHTV